MDEGWSRTRSRASHRGSELPRRGSRVAGRRNRKTGSDQTAVLPAAGGVGGWRGDALRARRGETGCDGGAPGEGKPAEAPPGLTRPCDGAWGDDGRAGGVTRRRTERRGRKGEGAGRRSCPHLLYGWLKVEVTGLFQVQPDHGHAGHGLHGRRHPPAPGRSPSFRSCRLSRAPRPSTPEVTCHAEMEKKKKCPYCLLGEAAPPVQPFAQAHFPLRMLRLLHAGTCRGQTSSPRRKGFWES